MKCRDSIIRNAGKAGISDGERRCLALASEVINCIKKFY